jgi:hypothetical protein
VRAAKAIANAIGNSVLVERAATIITGAHTRNEGHEVTTRAQTVPAGWTFGGRRRHSEARAGGCADLSRLVTPERAAFGRPFSFARSPCSGLS